MRRTAVLTAAVGGAVVLVAAAALAFGHIARFNPTSYTVAEGAGKVTITVERDGPSGSGSVDYATVNGSATAGQDFTATSGRLTYANGDAQKTFDVPILQDGAAEGTESFTIKLENPQGAVSSPGGPATVSITDDDQASPTPTSTTQPSPTPPPPTATPSRTATPTAVRTATPTAVRTATPTAVRTGTPTPPATSRSAESPEPSPDDPTPTATPDTAGDRTPSPTGGDLAAEESSGGGSGPLVALAAAVLMASAGGIGFYAWRRRAL